MQILKVSEMKDEYFPPKEDLILQNEAPIDFYLIVSGALVITLPFILLSKNKTCPSSVLCFQTRNTLNMYCF